MIDILLIAKLGSVMEYKKNQHYKITNPAQMNNFPR